MSSDVERLLEVPESTTASDCDKSTKNRENNKRGIWNYIYLYKMPQLTKDQLIGFSTKYKVWNNCLEMMDRCDVWISLVTNRFTDFYQIWKFQN